MTKKKKKRAAPIKAKAKPVVKKQKKAKKKRNAARIKGRSKWKQKKKKCEKEGCDGKCAMFKILCCGNVVKQRDDKAVGDGDAHLRARLRGEATPLGLRSDKAARVTVAAVVEAERVIVARRRAHSVHSEWLGANDAEQQARFKSELSATMPNPALPNALVTVDVLMCAARAAAMEALRLSAHDSFADLTFGEYQKLMYFVARQLVRIESTLVQRANAFLLPS